MSASWDISEIRVTRYDQPDRPGRPVRRRRRHWRLAIFMAALLAVIIVRLPHHHWSWPLFIWGAAIGLLIVPANLIVTTMVLRVLPLSEQTHSALLTRLRVRERSFYLPLVLGSLCFAAVSAARDSPVPDVIETACFAVAVGVPLWLLPKLRRGIARGRTY